MRTRARSPNPVFTPYTAPPASRMRCTASRAASTFARADSASTHDAPRRATASNCSSPSDAPSMTTGAGAIRVVSILTFGSRCPFPAAPAAPDPAPVRRLPRAYLPSLPRMRESCARGHPGPSRPAAGMSSRLGSRESTSSLERNRTSMADTGFDPPVGAGSRAANRRVRPRRGRRRTIASLHPRAASCLAHQSCPDAPIMPGRAGMTTAPEPRTTAHRIPPAAVHFAERMHRDSLLVEIRRPASRRPPVTPGPDTPGPPPPAPSPATARTYRGWRPRARR